MKKRFVAAIWLCIAAALVAAALTSRMTGAPETVAFWSPTGVWSVLPPIVAIMLAFATKNVVLSLFAGVLSGAYLLALQSSGPVAGLAAAFDIATRRMRDSVANPWNAGILLQCGAIAGMVSLITSNGGARAIASSLARLARGPASSQFVSWLLGLLIFFDDYANVQIRGPIMRPATDNTGVSREKFAYILDSTSAPIAGIALISTWIGTETSYISSGLEGAGLSDSISAYALFVESIPYRFYNLLTLAFVLLTALTLREFGAMRRCEELARRGYLREPDSSLVPREEALSRTEDGENTASSAPVSGKNDLRRSLLAAIPLAALVCAALVCFYVSGKEKIAQSGDADLIATVQTMTPTAVRECFAHGDASISIFQAALFGGVIAFLLSVCFGGMTASECVRSWLAGVKSLAFTFVILILAWSLASCIGPKGLGAASFMVKALSGAVPVFALPALIFLLAAVVSFATGTSYGTMAIITPLAIPFASQLAPGEHAYLVATTGAVLTGAIFGDHCSPISDTTILSTTSARCGLLEHVRTQLGYALPVALVSILFGFIPVGMGISVWISLPVSLAAVCAVLFIFGRKVPVELPADSEKTVAK